jgi:hypothetical protein
MGFGFSPFTQVHVVISLVGIAAGFLVTFGLLAGRRLPTTTAVFLAFTIATSVTGFFFPITQFTPALAVGGLSLVVLGVAVFARYFRGGSRTWQRVYAGTALFAQYLNVFVLVAQLFQKVPALNDLAPTQTEPPFGIAQVAVLLAFGAAGVLAVRRPVAPTAAAVPATDQPAGTAT